MNGVPILDRGEVSLPGPQLTWQGDYEAGAALVAGANRITVRQEACRTALFIRRVELVVR